MISESEEEAIYSRAYIMKMGNTMGNVEVDDRGRITIPADIREKLQIKSGDSLKVEIDDDKSISIKKPATKADIFKHLVGCISTPTEKSASIEEMKSIWKTNPSS